MNDFPGDVWAPTQVKNQHIIPRLLLANFADRGQVHSFNIKTGKCFRTSTRNAGAEAGFYNIELSGRKISTEGGLERVESAAAPLIRKLVRDPPSVTRLSIEDQQIIARLVWAQFFRNREYREMVSGIRDRLVREAKDIALRSLRRDLGEKADKVWAAFFADEPDERWLSEGATYQPAITTGEMLADADRYASALVAMPWTVGCPPDGLRFYVSDNGLSQFSTPSAQWAVFFEHIYYLPLSPTILLRIGPGLSEDVSRSRRAVVYSGWETIFANRLAFCTASQFLYGEGPFVDPEFAVVHASCD